MTMTPHRWFVVNLMLALPTAFLTSWLLSPYVGEWRSFLIGCVSSLLALEYVDHRRTIYDRRNNDAP